MPGRKDVDQALSELASKPSEGGAGEYEFWKAPDLLEDIRVGNLRLDQVLGRDEREGLRALLSGMIGLFITRHFGDEHAKWQLDIIEKFTFPRKFEILWTVVEGLSKRYGSGHLRRAWALRRLMYELSDLVELADPGAEDPAASVVLISPQADQKHELYPLVRRLCKRRTKLQSLAIRIYLEQIQDEDQGAQNEGGQIDERSLHRDLRRLKKWEDTDEVHTRLKKEYAAAAGEYHWKARIPVRLYSESASPQTPAEAAMRKLLAPLWGEHDTFEK